MSAVAANVNNELSTAEEKTSLFDAIDPVKSRSSVVYENIFPNADLEYILIGNDVKENIIVKSKMESYVLPFMMELGGNMAMAPQEDGSILVLKGEEPIYSIAAPIMYDANGEASDLVSYEPIEVKPGVYLLVTEADAEWINADGRAFPVTIDPSMNWYNQSSNMKVTYIEKNSAGSDRQSSSVVYVGKNSGGNTYRTLFKLVNLPTLPDNSTVSSAYLQFTKSSYSNNGRASIILQAQPLQPSSSYWSGSVNWTNCPALKTTALDYTTVSNSTTTFGFDISREFVRWFTNGTCDNGLAIVAMEESAMTSSSCAYICMSKTSTSPTLIINYRNTVGIESYYTYQTQSIGRAGTGYVGDYSGDLTLVKPIVEHASTVMPVSVALVYNSATSAQNYQDFVYNYDYGYFGLGWKLSCMESVHSTDDGAKLVYIDGDGTNHYFTWSSAAGKYADEDGLGLYISANGSNYTMTDRYGGTKYFYNNMLYWVKDANGNQTTYDISGGRVDKITRTIAGGTTETIARFNYDSSNSYLSSVTDSAGNVTSFTYTATTGGKNLTTITHADNKSVSYGYYGGKLAAATDNESGYQMSYTFGSNGRIIGIAEKVGGQVGVKIHARGTVDGLQIYCYPGADRQVSASDYFNPDTTSSADLDNLLTHIVFDYAGRTVNTYTTNYNGKVMYGADYAKYQSNSGTSLKNNRVLTASSVGVQPQNFVKRGGFETDTSDWSGGSISDTMAHTGENSYLLASGATAQQTVGGLDAGKFYVVSAYVNTENASGTGTVSINDVQSINYKTDGWERIWTTVQASGDTMPINIQTSGFGNVYIDDVQVEPCVIGETGAPSNVNLLENGNMEGDAVWNRTAATIEYDTADETNVMKMTSGPATVCNATQTVNLYLPGSETYMLSGWAKAESGPINTADRFALKAIIKYDDNTTETFTETFCKDYGEWQYLSMPIVPSQRGKTVNIMTVYLNYNYNVNTVYFDNIALVREEASAYAYNDNGDLMSVAQTDSNMQSYTYTGADLTQMVTMGSGTYNYTYDSKHNVTGISHDTTTTAMTYSAAGNVTNTSITSTTLGGKSITSSATYTNNNNLAYTTTDARGNTTTYNYATAINKQLGTPSSVIDAEGNTVYNTLTSTNGRLSESGISNVVRLGYTYSGGMLSDITRYSRKTEGGAESQQTYSLSYDEFKNLTSVKVGSVELAKYTYGAQNGNLLSTTYANGDSIAYTYDALDRVSEISYNDRGSVSYIYNGQGGLGQVSDADTGRIYLYNYDSLGRLIGMKEYSGSTIVQSFSSEYDSANRVSSIKYRVSPTWSNVLGSARAYAYHYSTADGNLDYIETPGGPITYTYDGFNRLTSKKTKNTGSTVMVNAEFAYLDVANTSNTSTLVQTLTNKTNSGATINSYTYEYDAVGNITEITGSDDRAYTYDDQGQMLKETIDGTEYTYTYDSAGNILTKSGGGESKTWSYAESGWRDKLVKYGNVDISYDASGNPTNWRGLSSLIWETGRRLMAATTDSGKNLTFTYDMDGLRLTKYDGSDTHKYVWQGDRLVSEAWGNEYIEFFYDESGMPSSFYYNNSISTGDNGHYYYVTNLQGDIVEIRDSSGTQIATYTYDAWGAIVDSVDCDDSGIVDINPLRYRGYYFDSETGLYYLQSRYYDPEVCRWLSPEPNVVAGAFDEAAGLIAGNVYAYCANNPVMYKDVSGEGIVLACIIIFGVVGAAFGGYIAAVESKAQLGYVNGWWVFGGVLAGGGTGCLIGWGVGAAATAIGAALTAGSSGTLGATIYANWQSAEQSLRNLINSVSSYAARTFQTPWGNRVVDAYNTTKKVIAEAKYGYQALSQFIQSEIARDAWLLETEKVKVVEWHFYVSQVTGKGGPSGPLLEALFEAGIKVIFH